MNLFFKCFLLFTISFFSCYSYSFKINTHVWIGQEVINDLEDGKLSFILDGKLIEIVIPDATKNAILNNRKQFLLSTLGPDAFPDVVAGQLLIHPGADYYGAWKTNDWLRYLFNKIDEADLDYAANSQEEEFVDEREIARVLAFGFLAHAASDVFAHTYVNQYAGDVFELTDSETVVEQRHFLLESLIGKYTPELKNQVGNNLGSMWDNTVGSQTLYDFVRDSLILDDLAANQFTSDTAPHLNAIKHYRDAVHDIAYSDIWRKIDVLIVRALAAYYDVEITKQQAEEIQAGLQNVLDSANVASEAVNELDIKLNKFALGLDQRIYSQQLAFNNQFHSEAVKLVDLKNELENTVHELETKHLEAACEIFTDQKLLDPVGLLDFVKKSDPGLKLINKVFGDRFDPSNPLDPLGVFSKRSKPPEPRWNASLRGNRAQLEAKRASLLGGKSLFTIRLELDYALEHRVHEDIRRLSDILALVKAIDYTLEDLDETSVVTVTWGVQGGAISSESGSTFCGKISGMLLKNVVKLTNKKNSLHKKVLEAETELKNLAPNLKAEVNQTLRSVVAIKAALQELEAVIRDDTSPISGLLKNWNKDIDNAISAYVNAASQSIVNTVNPNQSALKPLQDWFGCYQSQLIGLPSQIGGCQTMNNVKTIKNVMSNISTIIFEAGSLHDELGLPDHNTVKEYKERLLDDIKNKFVEELTDEFISQLPQRYQNFIKLQDKAITDNLLNQIFKTTAHGKSLIILDDFANKVKAEMFLKNGKFDPERFSVVANAVTLTKLSLLDENGIEQLFRTANINTSGLYIENLVVDAFANIDGNHQWRETSPPLPRQDEQYNYLSWPKYSSNTPFELWNDKYRDALFNKLFIGPLSPALVSEGIMSGAYPYQPCQANPFPNDENDKRCIMSWLIPVITGLN